MTRAEGQRAGVAAAVVVAILTVGGSAFQSVEYLVDISHRVKTTEALAKDNARAIKRHQKRQEWQSRALVKIAAALNVTIDRPPD